MKSYEYVLAGVLGILVSYVLIAGLIIFLVKEDNGSENASEDSDESW